MSTLQYSSSFGESKYSLSDTDKYVSLFPWLDKLILYTPTYVIKGRRCVIIHKILLILVVLCVLNVIGLTIYIYASSVTRAMDVENSGFIILMYILPVISSPYIKIIY